MERIPIRWAVLTAHMRFRTWPVAAIGLVSLVVLIGLSLLTTSRRAQGIYSELDQLNSYHRDVDTKLRRLRSDVNLSGIFIRDYLLDAHAERSSSYRRQLGEFKQTNLATLGELQSLAGRDAGTQARLAVLKAKLGEYWQAFDPLFDWTPTQRLTRSADFLRREVIPRRAAVLAIALEIEDLNNTNLASQRAEVARRYATFRDGVRTLLWQSLLLGLLVAVGTTWRLRILERRSEQQRAISEQAERMMRELSQQLVAAQEAERRNLSRELHDHVGQMLTALRMELGRIERLRPQGDDAVVQAVAEGRNLVDSMVRTVRDLALGLRPSMLDDFGLQAALEWLVRDLSRRYGLTVDLAVEGSLDAVVDPHRTCVYRVVQEALTNCVRHARATHVAVKVRARHGHLRASVTDDGIGVSPENRARGLGLRGIEERAKELGGTVEISDADPRGTVLVLDLTLPANTPEAAVAHLAG